MIEEINAAREFLPSAQIEAALAFAESILSTRPMIPSPTVFVGEMGISFKWEDGRHRCALVSFHDGTVEYGYAYFKGELFVPGVYQGVAGKPLPPDLLEYLRCMNDGEGNE